MNSSSEHQQLESIVMAQAKLLAEFVEFSLAEVKGKHLNTSNPDSKVQKALKALKKMC